METLALIVLSVLTCQTINAISQWEKARLVTVIFATNIPTKSRPIFTIARRTFTNGRNSWRLVVLRNRLKTSYLLGLNHAERERRLIYVPKIRKPEPRDENFIRTARGKNSVEYRNNEDDGSQMTQPDRLTIEEVDSWAIYWQHPGFENAQQVAIQLAYTMRDNERLREALKYADDVTFDRVGDGYLNSKMHKRIIEALSNKESDNGN